MKLTASISLAALACAACLFADSLSVKPGEWEATVTVQTSGLPPIPQEVLDKLTPQQKEMMEQRMKGNQTPRTTTNKSCITKEQIERGFDVGDNTASCTRTIISSTSSKQEIKIECTNGNNKTVGTIRVEASSSESVKGSGQMAASGGGHTMNVNTSFTAKWLGPTCEKEK